MRAHSRVQVERESTRSGAPEVALFMLVDHPVTPLTNANHVTVGRLKGRKLNRMEILQKFKLVIRENDFVELAKSKDGSISWFIKTSASMRLCIDVLTSSATVFWASGPSKLSSKTFRTVPSLKDWFALPAERQLQTMERLK